MNYIESLPAFGEAKDSRLVNRDIQRIEEIKLQSDNAKITNTPPYRAGPTLLLSRGLGSVKTAVFGLLFRDSDSLQSYDRLVEIYVNRGPYFLYSFSVILFSNTRMTSSATIRWQSGTLALAEKQ